MRPFRPLYINNANHWIDCAEQMLRNAAACPATSQARRDCMVIAEQYQTMANQAQNKTDVLERLARLSTHSDLSASPRAEGAAAPSRSPITTTPTRT